MPVCCHKSHCNIVVFTACWSRKFVISCHFSDAIYAFSVVFVYIYDAKNCVIDANLRAALSILEWVYSRIWKKEALPGARIDRPLGREFYWFFLFFRVFSWKIFVFCWKIIFFSVTRTLFIKNFCKIPCRPRLFTPFPSGIGVVLSR